MTTPATGRIVQYRMTERNAQAVNKRRQDAMASGIARDESGAVVHYGNAAIAGEDYPMVITRVHGTPPSGNPLSVNGQVLLDGNDTLWVTSVSEGASEGQYHYPTHV